MKIKNITLIDGTAARAAFFFKLKASGGDFFYLFVLSQTSQNFFARFARGSPSGRMTSSCTTVSIDFGAFGASG